MTNQPKEYYEKKPGFTVKSGVEDSVKKKIDYAVITDNAQGFKYTEEGNKYDLCNKTSYDLCGKEVGQGEPAKIIKASNGDIIIDATSGDIILKGMNIRIVAKDGVGEVTLTSAKHIALNAPITNIKGTNTNLLGSNSVSIGGQAVDLAGGMQFSTGVLTDVLQGSFLGQIVKVLDKFKSFLE
jgi:hypothetical protein